MSSVARFVRPAGLANSVPYSYGTVVDAGSRMVFLAGACPLDAGGRVIARGDLVRQAEACMDNARIALAASGAALGDVVFVRVLVASTSRHDLAAAWAVVHEALSPHEPPGTLQGVTVLGWEEQLVEVELVAAATADEVVAPG